MDLSPLFFNSPDELVCFRRVLLIQSEQLYGDAETSTKISTETSTKISTKTYRSTALPSSTESEVAAYHSFKSHLSGHNPPLTTRRISAGRTVSSSPSGFDGDKTPSAVVSVFHSILCASTTHGKPLYYSVSTFSSLEFQSTTNLISLQKLAHRNRLNHSAAFSSNTTSSFNAIFHTVCCLQPSSATERSIPFASSFMERSLPSPSCKRRRSPMWKYSPEEALFNIIPALVNVLSLGVYCVDPSFVITETSVHNCEIIIRLC
ncbi:unnamed protein product [Microthlaspi erraticum]|uniref:Uncharacterized protein n=1 Tax=Microthlaspi erraticum TaxID=1685480 RepID=A0A6D2J0E7_9BRAS|nr:unnamed protein product [Microthlaspi erraticum]